MIIVDNLLLGLLLKLFEIITCEILSCNSVRLSISTLGLITILMIIKDLSIDNSIVYYF